MSREAYIEDIIFMNKQNIPWSEVETYLKQYVGQKYVVEETKDVINIGTDFPEEFRSSLTGLYLYDVINIKKEASKPL